MNFHEGDSVMHWTYGLGKVIRLEERDMSGAKTAYYAVHIGDMTVWVPADDMLETRLRPPLLESEFKELMGTLSNPGEPLPDDRNARRTLLLEWLKNGRTESLCRVIRSLSTFRQERPLNDNDQAVLKRSQNALIGEWSFALSITQAQAELELHRLLINASGGD